MTKSKSLLACAGLPAAVMKGGDAYDWISITGTVVRFETGERAEKHIDELSHRYDGHGYSYTPGQEREILWEAELRGMTPEAVRAEYVSLTPLGRIEEPEDVADVVVFLASEAARFMTGQGINVTGGVRMD